MFCRKITFILAVAIIASLLVTNQVEAAQGLVYGRDGGTPGSVDLIHVDLDLAVPSSGVSGFTGLMSAVVGGNVPINRIDAMVATTDGNIAMGIGGDVTIFGGGDDESAIFRVDIAQALATFGTGDTLLTNFGQGEVTEALASLTGNALAYGNTFGGGLLGHYDAANTETQLLSSQGAFVNIAETSPGNIVWGSNNRPGHPAGAGFVEHTDLTLAVPGPAGSGTGTTNLLSGVLDVYAVTAGENGAAYSTVSATSGLLTEYVPGSLAREDITGGLATTGVPMAPLEGLANGNVMVRTEEGGAPGSLLSYDPVTNGQLTPHSKFGTGIVTQLIELSDGNAVYAVNNIPGQPIFDTHLRFLDTATGLESLLFAEVGGSVEELVPLDDGNFVFTSTLAGGNLSHFDVSTLTRTTLATGQGDFQGLVALAAPLAGDFDNDGDVDGDDFGVFVGVFGTSPGGPPFNDADFDKDGDVDGDDFGVFVGNFGTGTSTSTTIPEPTAFILILTITGLMACRRSCGK